MSQFTHAIDALRRGEVVRIRPRGNSMQPKISSGALVTIKPFDPKAPPNKGDVVLAKVNGTVYLHYVNAVKMDGGYQIANARGRVNGWTHTIYGIVTAVE